jgi:hypothetical protein
LSFFCIGQPQPAALHLHLHVVVVVVLDGRSGAKQNDDDCFSKIQEEVEEQVALCPFLKL